MRRSFPWLLNLGVPLIVALLSLRFVEGQDVAKWTIEYTLISSTVLLMLQNFLKFDKLLLKFDELLNKFDKLPTAILDRVTSDDIFKTISVAQHLLSISDKGNPLFRDIAFRKFRELRIWLDKLDNKEYVAEGPEVYDIYTRLILELEEQEEYFATTYVEDKFWEVSGGDSFFECNKQALLKGAKITRVFLYKEGMDVDSHEVVKKHIELREELKEKNLDSNFSLHKIEIEKVKHSGPDYVAEDKGILKDTYVMKLDEDARSDWRRATISINRDYLEQQKERFRALLRHPGLDHL